MDFLSYTCRSFHSHDSATLHVAYRYPYIEYWLTSFVLYVSEREKHARLLLLLKHCNQQSLQPRERQEKQLNNNRTKMFVFCCLLWDIFFENKTPLIFFRSHCWLLFNMLFLFFNYSDWCIDRTTKMKYLVYIRHRDKNYMFKFISILTTDLSSVENKKLFCHSTWIT